MIEVSDLPEERLAPPNNLNNHPRKPWLALLLAIVCSPIAFAYVGRPSSAIAFYALILAVLAAMGLSGAAQSVAGIWSIVGFAIVLQLMMIGIPVLLGRRSRTMYQLRWYNRWYLYAIFAVLISAPTAYLALNKEKFFGFGIYRVPSGSMSPTIMPGELIVVDTRPSVVTALRAEDVVTMTSTRSNEIVAKRIVAVPGQHVQIDAQGLKVDGQMQSRNHTQGSDSMAERWMLYPDVQLGPDEFYVMGDNRGNSFDSRTEGPVQRANLHGKVTTIYASSDSERLGPIR